MPDQPPDPVHPDPAHPDPAHPDPAAHPDTLRHVPLAEIDDAALTRDRSGLDDAALTELRLSIAASGLRMPVELFPLADPRIPAAGPPVRWGLISGLRRLHAFRALHELTGEARYAAIPAFLRAPGTLAEALGAMVEENEIREALSPWERGRIALLAQRQGIFGTIEEAVNGLYPAAHRAKRARLRRLAHLVDELDGCLTAPERLKQSQCLRLTNAALVGLGELMRTTLEESPDTDPASQWRLLQAVLAEAETLPADTPPPQPGRPRRVARPRRGLTVRREKTRAGYSLHFTGREASSALLEEVFDEIERVFGGG